MPSIAFDFAHAQLSERELMERHEVLHKALAELDTGRNGEFLRLAQRKDLLREIRAYRAACPARVSDVVQLGIGGSSLGAQAVCQALLHPYHNELAPPVGPRVHFPDNIDPESFAALLERLDPARTLVHVVSKSGGTLETAAQLAALLHAFSARDRRFSPKRSLVATTGASGTLREFARDEGIPTLTFPDDVAGRYSVFTASGLLVPALCGIPISRILAGARQAELGCRGDPLLGAAGRLAAIHHVHDQDRRRPIHVQLTYSDALQRCGEWFRQIWAESLGKRERGPTPITARGTTDQHSQIQLYMEGPDDKLYTVLRVARPRRDARIGTRGAPRLIARNALSGVFAAEAQGTRDALVDRGRPLVQITVPRVSPEHVGELLCVQQLQTALAGALYGVDPFTQPGVEAGKQAALRILSSGSPTD
jgi:glucose-6-phosphate isomerase